MPSANEVLTTALLYRTSCTGACHIYPQQVRASAKDRQSEREREGGKKREREGGREGEREREREKPRGVSHTCPQRVRY